MVGPVVWQELLLGSRRGKHHWFRWVYAGWLVLQLVGLYWGYAMEHQTNLAPPPFGLGRPDRNLAGRFLTSALETYVVQQLILLILVTPVFVAGAITDEKTTGTLQYLLTSGLTPAEVVVGKLLGRLAQLTLLALAGLPLFALVGGFGHVPPGTVVALAIGTVLPVLAVGSAAVLASVWCRTTRDAVLGLYFIFALLATVVAGLTWLATELDLPTSAALPLRYLDARFVLAPAWDGSSPRELWGRLLGGALAWGGTGAACLALAVWRLRPAYIRQLEGISRKGTARTPGGRAPVGIEPVRWKESQVDGIAPLAALRRVPRWLAVSLVFLATALVVGLNLVNSAPTGTAEQLYQAVTGLDARGLAAAVASVDVHPEFFLQAGVAVALAVSLVVGIRCSGAITGERERQTWEAVLLTPLPTENLVYGKHRGVMLATLPYVLAYTAAALPLAVLAGPAQVVILLIGLAATALASFFFGAAGLWCSVRSKTSWRSLVLTLAIGYVGGTVVMLPTSWFIGMFAMILITILVALDQTYQLGIGPTSTTGATLYLIAFYGATIAAMALSFLLLARWMLRDATAWVANRERTRDWSEDRRVRGPRRQRRPRGVTGPTS